METYIVVLRSILDIILWVCGLLFLHAALSSVVFWPVFVLVVVIVLLSEYILDQYYF